MNLNHVTKFGLGVIGERGTSRMDIPYSESLDRREGATTKNFGEKLEQSGVVVVMELSFVPAPPPQRNERECLNCIA